MRLFCATFAPARKWRKSYTLRCHCVTFALSSNFFEKKSTQKCWRRRSQYLAHPRHPLRRRAAPCASAPQPAPHSPPFPPPAAAAAAASTHLCSLLFFILWFFLVNTLCIPKNDDYGPAAHPAEAVPRGVDNDGSAELAQMVLFVIGALLLLLYHHHHPPPPPSSFAVCRRRPLPPPPPSSFAVCCRRRLPPPPTRSSFAVSRRRRLPPPPTRSSFAVSRCWLSASSSTTFFCSLSSTTPSSSSTTFFCSLSALAPPPRASTPDLAEADCGHHVIGPSTLPQPSQP